MDADGHDVVVAQRRRSRRGAGRTGWVFAVAALAASVWSCGSDSSPSDARSDLNTTTSALVMPPGTSMVAPSTTAVSPMTGPVVTAGLPATTVTGPITSNEALVEAIVPVRVTQPCPVSESTEDGVAIEEASRLEPMLGQVLAYGGQHSAEFGTYGLIWHSGRDASVFISFTTDIDDHRAALRRLVAFPDELIVCQVAVSADVARALYAKLSAELMPDQAASVGLGANGVEVTLLPSHAALKDTLSARYGDAVAVTICPDDDTCIGQPL
jgi:hypothetical protein